MAREAGPGFYTSQYYRTQCGGNELFRQTTGKALDPNRSRALRILGIKPGERVLDIGCGRGELVVACASRGAISIGVDFSPEALKIGSEETLASSCFRDTSYLLQMEAALLGFVAGSFDAVMMTDVVEHLAPVRLRTVVKEIHRVLKIDGKLIIHTAPTQDFIRYGQHAKRWLYRLRGENAPAVITMEDEERYAAHCNLQTALSLEALLSSFRYKKVEYTFTDEAGLIKSIVRLLGCARYLAFNLWAVAIK